MKKKLSFSLILIISLLFSFNVVFANSESDIEGDLDGDGELTILDVRLLLQMTLNQESSSSLDEVKFNQQTLLLDLGTNWEEMEYTLADQTEGGFYQPSQRYLSYKGNERQSYNFFHRERITEETLRVRLVNDPTQYKDIQISKPFDVTFGEVEEIGGTKKIGITTNSYYNETTLVEYCIDGGEWIEVDSNHLDSFEVDLSELYIGEMHFIGVRITDEFDNESDTFGEAVSLDSIAETKYRISDLRVDLGVDWDEYVYGLADGSVMYKPTQRYLIYEGTSQGKDGTYILSNSYNMFLGAESEVLRVSKLSDLTIHHDIEILNPFYVHFEEVQNNGTTQTIPFTVDTPYSFIEKVEYRIDGGDDWTEITGSGDEEHQEFVVDVSSVSIGTQHTLWVRVTDDNDITSDRSYKVFTIN